MSTHLNCSQAMAAAIQRAGLDSVDGAFGFGEGEDLVKPGLGSRRRTRLELTDESGADHVLYLKRYAEPGGPDAQTEAGNILALRKLKVPTMDVLAWGSDPGSGRSYLLVTAVPGDAMERCFEAFLATADPQAVARVTRELADLAARVHVAGFAHRDFYSSHVFMHVDTPEVALYLIDLGRMFRPRWRRRRWAVKDLAQLKASMPPEWVENHWTDFLVRYRLRTGLLAPRCFAAAVARKAAAIARRRKRKTSRKDDTNS